MVLGEIMQGSGWTDASYLHKQNPSLSIVSTTPRVFFEPVSNFSTLSFTNIFTYLFIQYIEVPSVYLQKEKKKNVFQACFDSVHYIVKQINKNVFFVFSISLIFLVCGRYKKSKWIMILNDGDLANAGIMYLRQTR